MKDGTVLRAALLLSATAAMIALAGCSGKEPGTPTNPSGDTQRLSTPSTTQTESGDVPVVDEELDMSPYLARPCELVPVATTESLGYPAPGKTMTAEDSNIPELTGPSCGWNMPDTAASLTVTVQTGNREAGIGGLQGMYDAYQNGQFEYWEPTTVADYPAAYSGLSDRRSEGDCGLVVGVANDLTFSVDANLYRESPQEACPAAKKVATAVVDTLKSGS